MDISFNHVSGLDACRFRYHLYVDKQKYSFVLTNAYAYVY